MVRVIASSYDKAGNLLTANDPDAKLGYTYDALNRVKTATTEYPGTSVPITTLTYAYDANGNRKSVVDNFGVRVDSIYSDRNELLSRTLQGGGVSAARVEFEYADNGERKLLERFSDATGTTLVGSTSYDNFANGLSKTITHKNAAGATLVNYDYVYDLAGRLKSEVHHGDNYQYGYDKTGQLMTVNKGGSLFESFSYDKNGNRKTSTGPNGDQVYAPAGAGNRLLNDGQNTYTYDDEGNIKTNTVIATGDTTEYIWDYRNRMVHVETRSRGGIVISESANKYDGLGRRSLQLTDGKVINTVYDRDSAWKDVGATSTTFTYYLFSDRADDLIARIGLVESIVWHIADRLGTIRDLYTNTGSLINTISYSAYGQILSQVNANVGDRFGFTGREYNANTKDYYFRARFYDPSIGKFTGIDPIGFDSNDTNLYRYVNNSTTNYTDPTGKTSLEYSLLLTGITGALLGSSSYVLCRLGQNQSGDITVTKTLIAGGLGALTAVGFKVLLSFAGVAIVFTPHTQIFTAEGVLVIKLLLEDCSALDIVAGGLGF